MTTPKSDDLTGRDRARFVISSETPPDEAPPALFVPDRSAIIAGDPKPNRRFRSARGRYLMAPGFDDPLPDFAEYQ